MKKLIYIGIFLLIGFGFQAQGQQKYKIQVKKTTGSKCGSCDVATSRINLAPLTAGTNYFGTYTGYASVPKITVTATANYAPFTPRDCVTEIASPAYSLDSCNGGDGAQIITSNFSRNIAGGPTTVGTCARDSYEFYLFATPSIVASGGSGPNGKFCASDPINLTTNACLGIDNPTLEWEYQVGGTWTEFAETTTGSTSISFASIPGAIHGIGIAFRVRYKNHPDLGFSTPTNVIVNTDIPVVTLSDLSVTQPTCSNTSNGSLTVNATVGSVSSYRYDLQVKTPSGVYVPVTATNLIGNANITPIIFNNLAAGEYRLKVISNQTSGPFASCGESAPLDFTITAPPPIALSGPTCTGCLPGASNPLTPLCRDGSIALQFTVSGGTAPYRYRVYQGAPPAFPGSSNVSGNSFSVNLAPGNHTVEVTDSRGCPLASYTANIANPATLTGFTTLVGKAHGFTTSCFGVNDGQVDVTPSGGQGGPYIVRLYKGGTLVSTQTNVAAKATFSNLIGGASDYTAVVSEGTCSSGTLAIAPITQPPAISATLNNYVAPTCATSATNYTANGQVDVIPSGGVGPFTIHLKNGATTVATATNIAQNASHTFDILEAGIAYTIEIIETGADGCGAANPYTTTTTPLTAPVAPTVVGTPVLKPNGYHLSCFGGNDGVIQVTPTNGSQVTNFDVALVGATTQTQNNVASGITINFTNLTRATYDLEVTEKTTGCTFTQQISLTEPPALMAFIERGPLQTNGVAHISCPGGSDGSLLVRPQGGGNGAPYNITVQNLTGYSASQNGIHQ